MPRHTPVHRSITPAGMQAIANPLSPALRQERWARQRQRLLRALLLGVLAVVAMFLIRVALSSQQELPLEARDEAMV